MAAARAPAVVISDVMLPRLDGIGLLVGLRRDARTESVPVIIVSARADREDALRAREIGADDYIAKPFAARDLLTRVRATVESARLRSRTAEARGEAQAQAASNRELRALLDDLKVLQRRVVAAADAERRRIERNLHDGAQQSLMAIRIELGLLSEQLDADPVAAQAGLDQVRGDLDEAVDELRELAHGLYPPLLASDGLSAALAAACRRASASIDVAGGDIGRLPSTVESAAYFCCVEALQNVAKHAGAEARASVRLEVRDGCITFRVRDDGRGFDARSASGGHGLTNLRDRLAALNGELEIASGTDRGTTVTGRIPVP
jgi:signal transduction histidine kinase